MLKKDGDDFNLDDIVKPKSDVKTIIDDFVSEDIEDTRAVVILWADNKGGIYYRWAGVKSFAELLGMAGWLSHVIYEDGGAPDEDDKENTDVV